MNAGDLTRGLEELIAERDRLFGALGDAVRAKNDALVEVANLNRACANRERAIVALARLLDECRAELGNHESCDASGRRFGGSPAGDLISGADRALADPLVVECVAQAADDAETRRDAKTEGA